MSIDTMLPFNIDLLILTDQDVKNIHPIKVLDIFDGFSRNFHPYGLYSTEIFGKVGEEKRNRLFSYYDMRIEIFHPIIFKALTDLKGLYGEIMTGKTFAVFNKETNDFDKSDIVTGETGYSFFLKHFKELKFEERPSPKREFNIKLINKYRSNCLMSKLVILPAGLRDYEVDENGKPSKDEINDLYTKVMAISSVMDNISISKNIEQLDSTRIAIQVAVNNIYEYIKNLLEGKNKLILGKWASRRIYNSTRNVITSFIPESNNLNDVKSVSVNQTVVGLYQYLRATLPLSIKNVRDSYLDKVFLGPNSPVVLINKKTMKKEVVNIDPDYYDQWMTYEGLEKIMAKFGEENIRHDYLELEDRYMGLIYKGNDKTYKFLQDIDDLPEHLDKKLVTPITFAELIYISVYKDSSTIPCFVTRYPISGYGSVYPSYCYLKTTAKSEIRMELDDNWEPNEFIANEFPKLGDSFYNSVSPSPSHISRLNADFDK